MRKTLTIVGSALLAYLILTWFTGNLLGLTGTKLWILRIALCVIGIAAAAVVVWFFSNRDKEKKAAEAGAEDAPAGGGEIAVLIRDAERKLSSANLEKGARIGNLPVILMLGETSATKTTVLLHSDLEPELLAGQVFQEGNVIATRSANIWYSRRMLFVEASGKLLDDAGARSQLVRGLQPGKLRAVVGQGGQAPRAVLVCVEVERLSAGGQVLTNLSRNLRARLGEIAELFGIQLPVYVLFTKTDRLPFFADFVRNLTQDESTQPLGATLPLPKQTSGVYAEEQAARLGAIFDRIFRSVCNARPELLSRENDASKLPGTYEFPREFRKLRGSLVQFLVDLCRPSQLNVGPFLRGFYFSAVRPVIVQEVAPAPEARAAERQGAPAASDATGMFSVAAASQAAAPASRRVAVSRKVPQWLFLSHLFNDVLLADRVAMGASGTSTKNSLWRHVLLIAAAVVCLVIGIGFTVSFFLNRGLESQVNDALRGTTVAPTGTNLASLDSLNKLEALRQSLFTLALYNRTGAPLSYRWGLYIGDELFPAVRRLYFKRFQQLQFAQSQDHLVAFLGSLPTVPGPTTPGYDQAYNSLKAYLITTSNHDKSSHEFLSPVLLKSWMNNQNVDADRQQVALKQFDFYADELRIDNPFSKQYDQDAVGRARAYLKQFGDLDRVYQAMKAGAPQATVNFNRQVAGSRPFVIGSYDVPGPFTKDGWKFMSDAIKNASRYIHGEPWVLGEQGTVNADPHELIRPLLARYNADYIKEWRNYLKNAGVVKYKDLKDASEKLTMLSGNQSPLMALFALASQNIPWSDPDISKALQQINYIEPAGAERYSGPQNKDYIGALIKLQTSIDAVNNSPAGTDSPAANQALSDAREARNITNQLAAQNFNADPEMLVQNLLLQPITDAESKLRGLGPDQLNAAGQALCGQFRAALGKYPFNPASKQDASVQDLNSILHNPEGALWQFYDANLKKFLQKQGSQYVAVTGGTVTLSAAFVSFFNQAAALSDALYSNGSSDPHLTYKLTWLPSDGVQGVGLQIDGQSMDYSAGAAAKQFTWQGSGTHLEKATVRLGPGTGLGLPDHDGIWAMFRFFGEADTRHATSSGSEQFDWVVRSGAGNKPLTDSASGKPLVVRLELDMAGSPAIFQKGFFSRLACVSQVAK